MVFVLCILFNLALLCQGHKQSLGSSDGLGFGYPESEEENPSKKNAQNKIPVNIPNKCRLGEILYPGDQGDDWVCDCRPAYLYYPAKQQCFPAYKKGPCNQGEYLVLRGNSVIPECVVNPCTLENYVPFRNGCHKLDEGGPCQLSNELSNAVGVNETTLEIICTQDYRITPMFTTRFGGTSGNVNGTTSTNLMTSTPLAIVDQSFNGTNHFKNECPLGGIRWSKIQCPQQDPVIESIFSNTGY